jgi:hypothetical protein
MKRFLLYILSVSLVIVVLLFATDYLYTSVYKKNITNSKFQFVRGFKDKKINYIFLGSSRVENNINPKIITNITGKTAVNFGFQAARLKDIMLLLELIEFYNIKSEKIFIQLDYIYNMPEGNSHIMEYQLIPFVNENKALNTFFQNKKDDFFISKMPFLRYALYDNKQGIRNITSNIFKKSNLFTEYNGYCPKEGSVLNTTYALPKKLIEKNKIFDSMRTFVKNKNLNVTFFCAPIRKDTEHLNYISQLSDKISNFKDLSLVLKDELLFFDNLHLNNNGATKFSKLILD